MSRRTKLLLPLLAPMLALVLWLCSGRENLTKSERPVTVTKENPGFDDGSTYTEMKPGPILGYYVGLDIVAIAGLVAAVAVAGIWLLSWRASNRDRTENTQ